MQRSMWKIFVLLAIVMTFGFVQTSWAGDRICEEDSIQTVTGTISIPDDPAYTDRDCWEIEDTVFEDTVLVICGVPDKLGLEVGASVEFTYDERPCGKNVACTVIVEDGSLIVLRHKKDSDVTVTTTPDDCTCVDCDCKCAENCEDCVCDCTCDCDCANTNSTLSH